jgi:hypothetical protein
VLRQLSDPVFDPQQTVLVSENLPAPAAVGGAGADAQITAYSPKRILIRTSTPVPGVLLLNDRYDPAWRVSVDGRTQPLLRCNFIMRGVQVPAGEHEVIFEFKPSIRPLYVSLAGLAGWLMLTVVLVAAPQRGSVLRIPPDRT